MYQLTINYPETLPDVVGSSQAQFEQEAKWAMAVKPRQGPESLKYN